MGNERRQQDKELLKSLYKYMLKKYGKTASTNSRHKDEAKTIVEDVIDPNYEAEVAPSKIPVKKPGVLQKAKGEEKQRRKAMGAKASWARHKKYLKTGTMKDGKKFNYPDDPRSGHEYGINKPYRKENPGTSVVGHHIKEKTRPVIPVKQQMKDKIKHLKNAPKPNLPKSEQGMEKADKAPKAPKAKNVNKLPAQRPRVKGVKRLKNYMKKHEDNNL